VPKGFIVAAIAAPTILIFLTMSGALGPLGQAGQSLWRVPYLFLANTPTGGDMGAHVLLPKVLMEDLLPSGRILGWSMDWYAGFPAMYFYFPLPALTTVLLDLVLPYGVAFKLTTIVGLLALPTCAYFFVKLQGFPRFVAAIAGVAGSLFVFMESYSIFGANIKSTLAGEFSFSWSFALSILFVGLAVRNYRNGTLFDPWAGVVLRSASKPTFSMESFASRIVVSISATRSPAPTRLPGITWIVRTTAVSKQATSRTSTSTTPCIN
jgi:hypothetical protein